MIARRLIVIPFILAGLWLSAKPSLACSCVSFTPAELAATSDIIFTGVARAYLGERREDTVVAFEVTTVYKGPVGQRAQVQVVGGRGPSGGLGAGCEYGFQLGRQYTVFARDHDSDGMPNTNGCFRNVEGPIDPMAYGLPSGHVPERADDVIPAIVAAAAIAAFAVITMVLRPRQPAL
jgi:hypothetical protein